MQCNNNICIYIVNILPKPVFIDKKINNTNNNYPTINLTSVVTFKVIKMMSNTAQSEIDFFQENAENVAVCAQVQVIFRERFRE